MPTTRGLATCLQQLSLSSPLRSLLPVSLSLTPSTPLPHSLSLSFSPTALSLRPLKMVSQSLFSYHSSCFQRRSLTLERLLFPPPPPPPPPPSSSSSLSPQAQSVISVHRRQQRHLSFGISPRLLENGKFGLDQSTIRWGIGEKPNSLVVPLAVGAIQLQKEPIFSSDDETLDGTIWEELGTEVSGRFVIVDGTPIVYRSYYKIQAQVFHGGLNEFEAEQDTAATVAKALSMILQLLELGPSHVAICFDARGMNFRHELYPKYKGHRSPTPDTVIQALPIVQAALEAMEMTTLKVWGVEADDVIATLTKTAIAGNMQVCICSPDKDFFQLLSPQVRLLRARSRGNGLKIYNVGDFESMYPGVKPEQFADMLALMGDQADNVPGVRGIGPKTAHKFIQKYGSVENLISNIESLNKDRFRKALENDIEGAFLCKRLVTLKGDLPDFTITRELTSFIFRPPEDKGEMFRKLTRSLQFNKIRGHRIEERLKVLWGEGIDGAFLD